MTIDQDKAAKLIRMLSSPNEGEVLNAARLLNKMDIHAVANLVNGGHPEVLAFRDAERHMRGERDAEVSEVIGRFVNDFPEMHPSDFTRSNIRSIRKFITALGIEEVCDAVEIASERVSADKAFRYFCGICRNRMQEAA